MRFRTWEKHHLNNTLGEYAASRLVEHFSDCRRNATIDNFRYVKLNREFVRIIHHKCNAIIH